jgi:hypothetical protein
MNIHYLWYGCLNNKLDELINSYGLRLMIEVFLDLSDKICRVLIVIPGVVGI